MASEATGQPGRSEGSRAARVPEETRVYAVGDIHGRADLLDEMLRLIERDNGNAPPVRETALVFVGDYVDRGPDSAGVFDRLLKTARSGRYTMHLLKGNHEVMFLDFLAESTAFFQWAANGGVETLESYDLDVHAMSLDSPERLRRAALAAIPEAHLDLLRGLETFAAIGDYLFVHAGMRPGVPLEAQSEHDLIWIREPFLNYEGDLGKVVVHGHTPVPEPEIRANRINIDTLAWRSGTLTSLVLEGTSRRFLST